MLDELTVGAAGSFPERSRDELLIERVLSRRARTSLRRYAAAAACVILVAGGVLLLGPATDGLRLENEALVNGSARPGGSRLAVGDRIEAGPEPVELRLASSEVRLLGKSALRVEGTTQLSLERGSMLAAGDVTLRADQTRITLSGRALLSREPLRVLTHVTSPEHATFLGENMHGYIRQWQQAHTLVAVSTLVLLVGEGQARPPGSAPLNKGALWTRPEAVKPSSAAATETWRPSSAAALSAAPDPEASEETQAFRDVVRQQQPRLSECYTEALAGSPGLEGRITLELTVSRVGDRGRIQEATIADDYSLQNPFVASCLLEKLAMVDFPAPRQGQTVRVHYPLVFKARGVADGSILQGATLREEGEDEVFVMDRKSPVEVRTGGAPALGARGARVRLVVFLRYDLAHSRQHQQVIRTLFTRYAHRVEFLFMPRGVEREPLRLASAAALAAHAQGQFLAYSEKLFEMPQAFDRATLERHAATLGLELTRFRRDMASPEVAAVLAASESEAKRVGATAVPTTFVNGTELVGTKPLESFVQELERALAE